MTEEPTIRGGTLEEALRVEAAIPEFGGAYSPQRYAERLEGRRSLILVSEFEGELVGYKVGYAESNGQLTFHHGIEVNGWIRVHVHVLGGSNCASIPGILNSRSA